MSFKVGDLVIYSREYMQLLSKGGKFSLVDGKVKFKKKRAREKNKPMRILELRDQIATLDVPSNRMAESQQILNIHWLRHLKHKKKRQA